MEVTSFQVYLEQMQRKGTSNSSVSFQFRILSYLFLQNHPPKLVDRLFSCMGISNNLNGSMGRWVSPIWWWTDNRFQRKPCR